MRSVFLLMMSMFHYWMLRCHNWSIGIHGTDSCSTNTEKVIQRFSVNLSMTCCVILVTLLSSDGPTDIPAPLQSPCQSRSLHPHWEQIVLPGTAGYVWSRHGNHTLGLDQSSLDMYQEMLEVSINICRGYCGDKDTSILKTCEIRFKSWWWWWCCRWAVVLVSLITILPQVGNVITEEELVDAISHQQENSHHQQVAKVPISWWVWAVTVVLVLLVFVSRGTKETGGKAAEVWPTYKQVKLELLGPILELRDDVRFYAMLPPNALNRLWDPVCFPLPSLVSSRVYSKPHEPFRIYASVGWL